MTTQKKPLLIVQHLSLAFGSITAVDDLSFVAPEDQITALVGPEGAGKTSVLNCVTGLCRPLTGRIELHGGRRAPFLLERMEHCRIARNAHVVRTFRNARLFASMTVLDNIVVAQNGRFGTGKVISSVFGFPSRRRALEKARHWLDRVGLSREGARVAAELSPALQRRVEIARALATEPRLICMDEPAIGLSKHETTQLADILRGITRDGIALLVTAQDIRFAEMLASHTVALDHGACIAAGSPSELSDHPAVLRAYLGLPPGGEIVPRIHASC